MAAVDRTPRPEDSPPEAAPGNGERGEAGRGAPPASVPSSDLERVIRRASELQSAAGEERTEFLDADEIVRIGGEVGLEPRHVRQALAEVRADALLPEPPAGGLLSGRLWGSALVRGSRVVPGTPSAVQGRVEEHFRERESLREVRRRRGRSVWEPSSSILSKMERGLDLGGRGYLLADTRRVELAVVGLEEGWSLATITADLGNLRARHVAGWFGGSLPFFGLAAVALILTTAFPPVGAGLLAVGASAGAAAAGPGLTFARRRQRIEMAVAGLLDRLESGGPLDASGPGWREKLLGT